MRKFTKMMMMMMMVLLLGPLFMYADVCTETNSASGTDDGPTVVTISSFPCTGGAPITGMTLNGTIGSYCPSWYTYNIIVNGTTVATNQCNQTGYDLTAYLPITSVSLQSVDMDAYADGVTLVLALNITYTSSACSGTPAPGNTLSSANPACPSANFTLSLQNLTPGSGVTYLWESSPDGSSWTPTAGISASYTTSQTTATWYQCQVTCAGITTTSTPLQVTMNPFMSCYCPSGATSIADEEILNVTLGSINNSSTCTTLAPGAGSALNKYSNYVGFVTPADLARTTSPMFSVQIGTCGGNYGNAVKIFIDFNQDGTFGAGEQVYVSAASTSGPHFETGTITIPVGATLGNTLMRVVNVETSPSFISACGGYSWGETEDYLVNITEAPACAPPAALLATLITYNSADLSWTPNGTETAWEFVYGLSPLPIPAGSGTPTASSTTNPISGLSSNTAYQFYVRADCGGGTYSDWAGPQTFTTAISCPAPTALGVSSVGQNEARLQWTENGAATLWDIEFRVAGSTFTGVPTDPGVASNPFNYGGLTAATSYTYYVRAACGGDLGNSTWAGPFTFQTLCEAFIAPYMEQFTTWPPLCWNLTGGSHSWVQYNVGTVKCAKANFWSQTAGATDVMTTPVIDVTGMTSPTLKFDWSHLYSTSYPLDGMNVLVSDDGGTTWTTIWSKVGAAFNSGDGAGNTTPGTFITSGDIDLTPYGDNLLIKFLGNSGYGPDAYVDNVQVYQPLAHDAGTVSIDDVGSTILIGSTVIPKATVKNFGTSAEVFDVTMTATGGYTSTVTGVSLAAGASTQVTFAAWTPALGSHTVQVCTQLAGDMDPLNDCKSIVTVVSDIAWSSGTAFPTGTYMGSGVGYTDNTVSPPVGYLFSIGGNTNSALNTECYKYNETTNTWSAIASLPVKRVVEAAAIVGTNIYVIGGSDGVNYTNVVFKYDILTDTWSTVASMPVATGWGKAVAIGTNIYFAGGLDVPATTVFSTVYVYNTLTDTWAAATSMPGARFGGAFAGTGNKLVYVGGADLAIINNTVFVGTISGVDPTIITWATAKSPYPGTTGQPSGQFNPDLAGTTAVHSKEINNRVNYPGGTMYRFDGAPWGTDGIIVAAGSPTASWVPANPNPCYAYNPTTDVWTAKPDVPTAVLGASTGSVDLNNGGIHTWKLILASGYTGTAVTAATQVLTEIMAPAAPLAVTGTATDVTGCFGNSNGTITTTVTGGTPGFSYLWSTGAATANLTGLPAGTYTVTVTDATMATATGNWTINQPAELMLSAETWSATCPTSTDGWIDISVGGGTTAYVYSWSNGAITQDISGLSPGTYTVNVTDANGCGVTGSWVIAATNPVCANIAVTGTVSTSTCYNALVTITVSNFTVTATGSVLLYAGQNILLQPGTVVLNGGYLLGRITTDVCPAPAAPITAATTGQIEPQMGLTTTWFTLFPNPTSGNFTLVQKGEKTYGTVKVEVYSMNGEKIMTERMIGEQRHEFQFSNIPVGLYFVKIVADNYVETIKLIKTR